jgi:hypothetical protein
MHLRKLNNKVNTDDVPSIIWSLQGVKLSIRSTVLQPHLIAKVTGSDIDSNVSGHLWPPVVAQYEFKCFKVACMSSDTHMVMLLDNVMPQVSFFGDMNLTSEHK